MPVHAGLSVQARKLFYEGTKAFKSGDFPEAGKKYKEGLALWQKLLEQHPHYRDDDLNKKDTGIIVRRYTRVLANLNEPIPDDLPFKDLLKGTRLRFNGLRVRLDRAHRIALK